MVHNRLLTSMILISIGLNLVAILTSGKRRLWLLGWLLFLLLEFLIGFTTQIDYGAHPPENWNAVVQLAN